MIKYIYTNISFVFESHCIYSALMVTQYLFQSLPGNFINVDPHSCDMIECCEEMFTNIQGKALKGLDLQDKKYSYTDIT